MRRVLSAMALAGVLAGVPAVRAARAEDWGDVKSDYGSAFDNAPSKEICRQAKGAKPPPEDLPDAAARAALKDCDSEKLYYGIGMPADPAKARQCAFLERERDDPEGGGSFSGEVMLMTIYANGVGARRDFDLATHYACQLDGAPAEMDYRIQHLAELKAKNWQGHDFDFCNAITSGYAQGQCAVHEAEVADARRDARLAALTAPWTPAEKAALAKLQAAEAEFVEALDAEVDLSGTGRVAFEIEAQ